MFFLESLLAPALVVLMVVSPLFVVLGLLLFWKRFVRNRNRRSPLTSELLRTPGYGVQDRIDELTHDISGDVMMVTWLPLLGFGMHQMQTLALADKNVNMVVVAVGIVVAVVAGEIYQIIVLMRRVKERQKYREALAGEVATAQLLEPVIAGGGRVLHDVQAKGFNIDHVVVAPGGIFAVETKHRLKSTKGEAKEQARVTFDGQRLRFPNWVETKPIEQARAQARWLSERLSNSTGMTVKARAVIALPGWFVEQTAPSDVIAINPKNCAFMLKPRRREAAIQKDEIQRIAFQVEQLCPMPNPGEAARGKAPGANS